MRLAIALVVVLAFPAFVAGQATWYVPDDFPTIQEAINGSATGDSIIVRPGAYFENINFNGKALTLKSEVGPDVTVIDGSQAGSVVTCKNNGGQNTLLEGFLIRNGSGTLLGKLTSGGGMFNHQTTLTVHNCIFRENRAQLGGGIYNHSSEVTLTDCTISENEACFDTGPVAAGDGGGICSYLSDLTITNCTFNKNRSREGGGLYNRISSPNVINCTFNENTAAESGGGMHNSKNAPIVSQCTFQGNSAGISGGGVYNSNSDFVIVSDCIFRNNQCEHMGAGILNGSSKPSVTGCIFSENTSDWGGGGIYNYDSESKITDCVFRKNKALGWGGLIGATPGGGGMANSGGTAEVTECLFIENEATDWDGGGMVNMYCDLTMFRCTFLKNYASEGGSGLGNKKESNSTITQCRFIENFGEGLNNNRDCNTTVTNCSFERNTRSGINNWWDTDLAVTNCTFYGNMEHGIINNESGLSVTNCILWGHSTADIKNTGGVAPIVSYSCMQDDYPGKGNIKADPLFMDPENNDFHLTRFSPCINRGTSKGAPLIDFDGDPRPFMGTVDMGADEFTSTHTLSAYSFTLSQSTGGVIPLFLQAGASHAGQMYCMFSNLSGTSPGLPLPGGQATLPINPDAFTHFVLGRLNTPYFFNFLSVLNAGGMGSAVLDIPAGAIPLGGVGYKMHFAYTIDTLDLASNPVKVEIVQ